MPDQIYVVGHINPDTDSIASAMGYAWLLRERDGLNTVAARAGALNAQTSWVLKTLKLESPFLLTDASPRFESVMQRLDSLRPDAQLGSAWTLASRTGGLAPVVNEDGTPYGIISGMSLFKYFSNILGPRPGDTTVREMMAAECRDAADTSVTKFQANAHIRDSLNRILRDEIDDYWVVDESGRYLGIARQRNLLNPPRLKIILVDHNEPRQSIAALEEAELLEILDHHRLGNPYTHQPIRFTVDVVGSTSTLVTEQTAEAGLSAPPAIAVQPDIILMDEPCSALDPIATAKVEDLILELAELVTVVIVTHNMQQAARLSHHTAFFYLGKLVEFSPTARLFSTPADARTEAYVTGRFG